MYQARAYFQLRQITGDLAGDAGRGTTDAREQLSVTSAQLPQTVTGHPLAIRTPGSALWTIEKAARACGLLAERVPDLYEAGAVRITLDGTNWYICPDPASHGWRAIPAALTGNGPEPDPAFTVHLAPSQGEATVPTRAWASFLAGDPEPQVRPRRRRGRRGYRCGWRHA
jgi:hypothetical protein